MSITYGSVVCIHNDGQNIDTWIGVGRTDPFGAPSQTAANIRLEPLVRTGAPLLPPANGTPFRPPFANFTCS